MRNLDKQTTFVQEKEKLAKLHHELGQRRDKLKALQGNRGKTMMEHHEKQTTLFAH